MHNPISLQTLATEIIVEHAAARRGGADDSKHALAAGQGLIAAKALVRPGEWPSWLKVNLPNLSIPTCQRLYANGEAGRLGEFGQSLREEEDGRRARR